MHTIPKGSLVILVGPSGAGKSTYCAKLVADGLPETAIVSSDRCREEICDDEADQSVTPAAFQLLGVRVQLRLGRGHTTVVDATSLLLRDRKSLYRYAAEAGVPVTAVRFEVSAAELHRNDRTRPNPRGEDVVDRLYDRYVNHAKVDQLLTEGCVAVVDQHTPLQFA